MPESRPAPRDDGPDLSRRDFLTRGLRGRGAALLAGGVDPFLAAGYAAYAHVLAADLAADGAPVPASGLMAAIPAAIRAIRRT